MDCQGLVARLVMDFVLLTTAVEVAARWRDLAERLAKVSRQQMEAYEAPHRDSRGQLDSEVKQTLTSLKEIVYRNMKKCCQHSLTLIPSVEFFHAMKVNDD